MKKFLKENKFYLITVLIVILLFQIKLPYYVNAPGGVININDRISYDERLEVEGSLNLLYVTEYVATIPTYLLSYIMKDWDLEDIQDNQVSSESPEEINTRNRVMLDNSIQNALYVAYQAANCKIEIKDRHNIVIGTTVENDFKIGDEILEMNDKVMSDFSSIKEELEEKDIGDLLKVKVLRNDKEKVLNVRVRDIDGKSGLGIIVITNYDYDIDPEIELKFKSSESGSSGGLMMALSIYSALSGEDILKGRDIAGTGTIDVLGNVGEIAGVKYKIMGAYKNKMDVVLVPEANYEEAKDVVEEYGYDMEVVKVKTFDDAIHYLRKSN